jgi:diketogulonate reductase-like aldo/keto reductase
VAREEIFLTTKVWRSHMTADRVAVSIDESLRSLGLDYVDLLLAHWPVGEVPLAETMSALQRVSESGKARHIGVSNFTPGQVRRAAEHARVFCNQVEYHPLLGQDKLLAIAAELDHVLTAYSPVAQGAVAREPVICRIAARHGKSPVQVALRWLVQQPYVSAIPRSGSGEHRAANIEIFNFELTGEEMSEIHKVAATRNMRLSKPAFGPDW